MNIRISAFLFFGFFLWMLPRQIFAQITTQVGGGASLPSGGWMIPSLNVEVTTEIHNHVFGLGMTGVQKEDGPSKNENFGLITARYYTTNDLSHSKLYAYGGWGCAVRRRAIQSTSSSGANFFGSSNGWETTMGPCAEAGLGTSISLTSHSFISFVAWGNLNAMQPFAGLMILLGSAWK